MNKKLIESALSGQYAKKLVAKLLVLCIISATIAGSSVCCLAPRSSGQPSRLDASYTIWRDGSTYYAEDAYGNITNSTDASAILNGALSNLTIGRTWEERVLIVGDITITSPLTVYNYTILQLDGTISLANNINSDLVQSANFSTLTEKNSTGGIHDVEFTGGVYWGNYENSGSSSTFGYGFELYGERYTLDNLEVRNCTSGGIYSEWANSSGVYPSVDAMESMWTNVRTCFNGGNGITMRGPHDSVFTNCITYCNNGRGISIEGSPNYTGGGLQLVNFHSYGNVGDGIWSDEYFLGSSVQSESNDGVGVCILHNDVHLSALQIYNNRGVCAIEIGNATIAPKGVMIEAATINNTCSLDIVNDSGNSYTITCWENPPEVKGNFSVTDYYNILNTKTGVRYESGGATLWVVNQLWSWPTVGAIIVVIVIAAYLQWRTRRKKPELTLERARRQTVAIILSWRSDKV